MLLADIAQQVATPSTGTFIIWDWATLASISFAFGGLGSLITWVWNRGGKSALLQQKVKDAESAVLQADERTDRIQAAYNKLLEDLHNHMLADAAAFAKLEAVAGEASRVSVAAELRLTASMDNLGKRVDAMAARFDEFMTVIARTFPIARAGDDPR